ncbi:hypothetical protein GGH96_001977 [Coemansia sp. RSA 1972]|nr:hypothetical protein GGH96_001977 [Coemansia sp. RSA 1972]
MPFVVGIFLLFPDKPQITDENNNKSNRQQAGIRRSVSTRLLGKSSKSTSDLRGRFRQPHSAARDYGSDREAAIPEEDFEIGRECIDLGKGFELSFGGAAQSSEVPVEPTQTDQAMDIASTSVVPQFAKRPAARTDRMRYEAVGYPKSTRAPKREGGRENGGERQLRHQQSQPRLQGFEMRVIDTHGGRTIVRTPVLANHPQGSDCEHDKVPKLPPPSAAELRYNAQRALINSTAILRATVVSKQQQIDGYSQLPGKASTVRLATGSRPQPKSLARTASERAQTLRISGANGSGSSHGKGFQISMQFESEQAKADRVQTSDLARIYVSQSKLEQGNASSASMLEQWGMSKPSQHAPMRLHQGQDGTDDDSDSAGEDTLRMVEDIAQGRSPTMFSSALGPDNRASSVLLSDESQQLIDSIFGGRLSVDSSQRFSRCEGSASNARLESSSALSQPANMSPSQNGSSQDPGGRGRPRMGTSWTQPSQSLQTRPQEPGERDGNKMRKPSFWSIFRGGTQRKDQEDKRDISDTASVHSRHHVLRKQQSTSSGFAESIGFTKRLNQSETKFGTITSSHLFTNKALPSVPPSVPSPPLPLLRPAAAHTQTPGAEAFDSADSAAPAMLASGQTSALHSDQPAMSFAPDASASSSHDGLSVGTHNSKLHNSSIDSQQRTSKYYSPMDEFFSVASADDRLNAADQEGTEHATAAERLESGDARSGRTQGADINAGTPNGSPAIAESTLKYDSAAAVVAVDTVGDSDDDSDIVPLSQSRVLVEAGARNELSVRLANNAASRDEAAHTADSEANEAGGTGGSGQMCADLNSVNNGSKANDLDNECDQAVDDILDQSNDRINEMPVMVDDVEGAASNGSLAESSDNTQLARAMGRYLYDIEEYYCRYYASQGRKDPGELGPEPDKPSILHGIDIPALVDHAEWLGKREIFNALTLRYYITNFEFGGQRIDECLRRLCSHIYLRGESQVIDRLLVALAQRYVECNADTRLLTADVAHAVTYSTLLLNTDLHIADIRSLDRMTRSRFVRNTIDTITQFQSAASGLADEPALASPPPQLPELDLTKRSIDSAHGRAASLADAPLTSALDEPQMRTSEPSTLRSLVGSMASLNIAPVGTTVSRSSRDVVRLMGGRGKRFSFFESSSTSNANGTMGLAGSVSASATPVLGSATQTPSMGISSSPSSLRAFDRLRRKVSTSGTHGRSRSGTVSMDESPASVGRATQSTGNAARSGASGMPNLAELTAILKEVYAGIKSRPLGQPAFARQATLLLERQRQQQQISHDHLFGARTSVALAHGKHSLEVDTAHSRLVQTGPHTAYADYDSHSSAGTGRPSSARSMPLHAVQRTRSITSMNMGGRPPQHPDLRPGDPGRRGGSSVLNFGAGVRASPSSASMGFAASPAYTAYMRSPLENQHIRSGVLVRKHLFERAGKKASHRAWRTCYVSVDRGTVAMYKMDGRHGHPDGRELTDTSLQLGSVSLRHTMTHMLPPPGYSRSRPHVFALQLPSGGVYLFQTASEIELRDWVAACNYWAARESKAPYMIGGVYNMEYGWDNTGDFTLRFDERDAREERGEEPTAAEVAADERRVAEEREASRGASILEWTPPNNPMQRSDLDEAAQLKALMHHIAYLEEELVAHKKVQGSIDERFFPRTQQHHRAFSNWERKAQYILQELIKYQSYADVLQKALKQMQEDATPPIPEECDTSPAATVNGARAPSYDDDDEMHASAPVSQRAPAPGLTGSRASLPQSQTGGRGRTSEGTGMHTPSKSLPIKELLAPASDKVKHRASIIASPAFDERRRGSQPQETSRAGLD